jgi:hypothetical protein
MSQVRKLDPVPLYLISHRLKEEIAILGKNVTEIHIRLTGQNLYNIEIVESEDRKPAGGKK